MSLSPPYSFDARRFKSTAQHYLRGRLAYPPALIERVVERVRLTPEDRVLDLGCGPGFLAVAFRRHVREAVGIDPEPDMLEAAALHARENRVEIVLRQGSSHDLDAGLGLFRLVAMGRSFHWMDRVATLKALDALIVPDGAVALLTDRYLDVPENAWRARYGAFLDTFRKDDAAREVARSSRRSMSRSSSIRPFPSSNGSRSSGGLRRRSDASSRGRFPFPELLQHVFGAGKKPSSSGWKISF